MKTKKQNSILNDVTVIIRSAHERTEALCKKLISDQGVPENHIFIIHEVPFSAAMKKSFKIGIDQQHSWTYCVDADVLLRPRSIEKMREFAWKQKSNVCEIQGYMMDKFFGGVRKGGVHLYRTSLLPEALKRIPAEGVDIRPERRTLTRMKESGYPWVTVPYIVGIHDDEQYNADIYRKAFVQGIKHTSRAGLFLDLWREKSLNDHDFKVALRGFSDSVINREDVFINREQTLYHDLFVKTGFTEKKKLNLDLFSLRQVEKEVQSWIYPDVYYSYFPNRDGLDKKGKEGWGKIKRNVKNQGIRTTVFLTLSEIFLRIGNRLRSLR